MLVIYRVFKSLYIALKSFN